MSVPSLRRVCVLINRRSGTRWSLDPLQKAFTHFWDLPGTDLVYQFCTSAEDGRAKARRAVERRTDILLVVGGDGTVSTVGAELLHTDVALAVIPAGSGNGFARHFGIPLAPERAIEVLANGVLSQIDVGTVNRRPFLVTCSMAWDAAIVRSFDRSPVRGVLPYVLAGAYEFMEYRPQRVRVEIDGVDTFTMQAPILFTVANLTQFGGGAVIAPHARPDDGLLELVAARHQDVPVLIANFGRLFDGTLHQVPNVVFKTFRSLVAHRSRAAPIQVDGELVDAPASVEVKVLPKALKVLTPGQKTRP